MTDKTGCSKQVRSQLVELFVRRTPEANGCPYEAMRCHIEKLRAAAGNVNPVTRFEAYLTARSIVQRAADPGLSCDGFIEPIGSEFSAGFQMVVRQGTPVSRARFTMAHEVCHTFFYELVPELKFIAHGSDQQEEQLCNYGAAELLVSSQDLRKRAQGVKPSITDLRSFAEEYGVSMESMLLRLRTLRLWDCELSIWHRKSNGAYALDRIIGWKKLDWHWENEVAVQRTWDKCGAKVVSGSTFVFYFDERRHASIAKRVYVQSMRRGDSIIALWSERPFAKARPDLPLFAKVRNEPTSRVNHKGLKGREKGLSEYRPPSD